MKNKIHLHNWTSGYATTTPSCEHQCEIPLAKNIFTLKYTLTQIPDSIDAVAAMMKEMMTPGPAISLATMPATTNMPVPTQLPAPSEIKSMVLRHLFSFVVSSANTLETSIDCKSVG